MGVHIIGARVAGVYIETPNLDHGIILRILVLEAIPVLDFGARVLELGVHAWTLDVLPFCGSLLPSCGMHGPLLGLYERHATTVMTLLGVLATILTTTHGPQLGCFLNPS